jgi:hypothetical protein
MPWIPDQVNPSCGFAQQPTTIVTIQAFGLKLLRVLVYSANENATKSKHHAMPRRLGVQSAMVGVWIFEDFKNPGADLGIFVLANHGNCGTETSTHSRS